MRIADLTAYHVRIPFRGEVRHASHARTSNETLLIRCRLKDGSIGWGEGLPRPYVTGETIETVWQQLQETNWTEELAAPFDSLRDAISLCESFQLSQIQVKEPSFNERNCLGNSLRCAIELAILDAAARSFHQSFKEVTSLVECARSIQTDLPVVRYSAVIPSVRTSWKLGMLLRGVRLWKFQDCKVKVGTTGQDDADLLGKVRRILGSKVQLRVDANEAWNANEVCARMKPLLRFGISSLEQPVAHREISHLKAIREELSTPIMLDESLCSLSDATMAMEQETCDLFNLRLSKCGGFLNCLKLASLVQRAGLGYQLGCQVGETGILSAAGRHFATTVKDIRFLEGSFDRYLLKEQITKKDLTFRRKGIGQSVQGPGLGVAVDLDVVERLKVKELPIRVFT